MRQVLKKHSDVQLRIIHWVQPRHPQAYYLTQAAVAARAAMPDEITDEALAEKTYSAMDFLYSLQDDFSDEIVAQKTAHQLQSVLFFLKFFFHRFDFSFYKCALFLLGNC